MFKKNYFLLFIFLFLSSCSDFKKQVGLEKNIPNEFLIEKREALSFPPDYKILPPGTKEKNDKISNNENSVKLILDKDLELKKSSTIPSELEDEILRKIK